MDQGIIQAMKLKFKKKQLLYLFREMDRDKEKCGSTFLKQINMLDCIYWVAKAWEEVDEATIQKCFKKAGFVDTLLHSVDDDDDIPLNVVKMARDMFGCKFKELVEIDNKLSVCDEQVKDWETNAQEILKETSNDVDDNDDDDRPEAAEEPCISIPQGQQMVKQLQQLALKHGRTSMLNKIMEIDDELLTVKKQCSISDFLKSV